MTEGMARRSRWKIALALFVRLRVLECATIALTCLVFEITEQLSASVFPQIPLAIAMVPFGLYVGFGYLPLSLLAFFPLIWFRTEKNALGLVAINAAPLALLGISIQRAVFSGEFPGIIQFAWAAALVVNVISAIVASQAMRRIPRSD